MKHECFKIEDKLICYCGKCESDFYPLPRDYKKIQFILKGGKLEFEKAPRKKEIIKIVYPYKNIL